VVRAVLVDVPLDASAGAAMSTVFDLSHVAVNTADLDRFRRFYEGLLDIPVGLVMRLDHPPYLRHATFHVNDVLVLHVFEVPGYDPVAAGIGTDIGQRGRIDHFGLLVRDEAALGALAERLRTAGATDGEIRPLGPVLSLHVTDPDGLQFEINCPNLAFDVDRPDGIVVEEVGTADWLPRMFAAVQDRAR
jgi:catechol 2,3-dioxygenase-like lactoylglutathione lyase family enzyme